MYFKKTGPEVLRIISGDSPTDFGIPILYIFQLDCFRVAERWQFDRCCTLCMCIGVQLVMIGEFHIPTLVLYVVVLASGESRTITATVTIPLDLGTFFRI